MRYTILVSFVAGAFVAGTACWLCSPFVRGPSEPNLLSQLKEADDRIGQAWQDAIASAMAYHPPKPFRFPPVDVASPVLWDWYEHAVIMNKTRQWIWSGPTVFATAYGSSTSTSTSTAYSVCSSIPISGTWYTVVQH